MENRGAAKIQPLIASFRFEHETDVINSPRRSRPRSTNTKWF